MPNVRAERASSRACLAIALPLLLLTAPTARAASVSWVGPAVGGSWTDAMSWSGMAVPTAGDDVTIVGANVAVGDAEAVNGLTLSGDALLNVSGVGASLTVSGPANIDSGRLFVMDSGQLDLSTVGAVNRTLCGSTAAIDFITVGAGGSVDLSGVKTLAVNAPSCSQFDLSISIFAGGSVDLSGLQSIAPAAPHTVTFNVAGAVDLQKLATATATTVNVQEAATVSLPSLTSFQSGTLDVISGQQLTANALTQASDTMFFASTDQGLVMNALTSVSGGGIFLNTGAHIMLPALTTLLDVPMQIQDGAELDAPALTSYTADRVGVLLSGGVLNAPALRNLSNIDLTVSKTVSMMSLPGVTSYSWTLCSPMGLGTILAGDTGSKIDLSGVQMFTIDVPGCGPLAFNIGAVSGGTVDLSGLKTIVMTGPQELAIVATDPGSVIDLSSLTTFPPSPKVIFEEINSGQIIRPGGAPGGGGGGGGGGAGTIRMSISDMQSLLAGAGVDKHARKKLGALLTKADRKLTTASGTSKRAKRARNQVRSLLLHFAALVRKLQPKHITDPAIGAALAADAAGALQGVSTL